MSIAMSPAPACGLSGDIELFRFCDRSSANRVISATRCAKFAGLGILSALYVLNRRSSRCGSWSEGEGLVRAEVASVRWPIEGGLKLESSMYSV